MRAMDYLTELFSLKKVGKHRIKYAGMVDFDFLGPLIELSEISLCYGLEYVHRKQSTVPVWSHFYECRPRFTELCSLDPEFLCYCHNIEECTLHVIMAFDLVRALCTHVSMTATKAQSNRCHIL